MSAFECGSTLKTEIMRYQIPGRSPNLACTALMSFLQEGVVTLLAPRRRPICQVVKQPLINSTVKLDCLIPIDSAVRRQGTIRIYYLHRQ